MALDKELYRQAYEWYRQWNEAELIERAHNVGKLTPLETWKQYAALWEFAVKSAGQISHLQRQHRLAELEAYYALMQKFESWRQSHGK